MSVYSDDRQPSWSEYWTELVELYEYKVRDLLDGKSPRGGKRSLGNLRDLLMTAPLDGQLMRRFRQTDRLWKAHLHTLVQARLQPSPEQWVIEKPPSNTEQDTLEGLRFVVWRERVRELARTQAQLWMREGELITLRCAYALDVNLERGDASMEVPRQHDALVSLGTASVSSELMTHLTDQLCAAFIEPPAHHPGARQQALIRLRGALTALAINPFPRHKDQDVTTARVQAAEREPLGPELKRTLIEGLQIETGGPRPAAERLAIRGGVEQLSAFLESLIPVSEGGEGPELPPIPQVLFAAQPRSAMTDPDDGSSSLTIRLSGGTQTHWRGVPLNWRRSRESWLVTIGALDYRFYARGQGTAPDPETHFVPVVLGEQNGYALLHGDYLYLEAQQNDRGLLELLALSRAVALLLDPSGAYLNLRLARAAAQRFRDGRIDPQGVNVVSAERYSAASPDALLSFARKGAEGLLTRLRQRPPQESEYVFRAAAEAVDAPDGHELHLLKALRRVHEPHKFLDSAQELPSEHDGREAASPPLPGLMVVTDLQHSARIGRTSDLVMLDFSGEPITVEVAGRALTLRLDYKGDLAVILPGAPVTLLRELLVIDVAAGGLLLVRQGSRIVVSYEPHVGME
ncbi:hypothetical protein [Deinococcus ruber]|uniref:hypothetical protein n=1 Tax=Deinococcus ruber TaxID=1848197 RepID=UPI001667C326|nr:hypothetical protein [Deinococcus ruber]